MFPKLASSVLLLAAFTSATAAPDAKAELERAESGRKAAELAFHHDIRFYWSAGEEEFLVCRFGTAQDEHRFFLIATATGAKSEAFDHGLLAKSLGEASGHEVKPEKLPIDSLEPLAPGLIRFHAFGKFWQYSAADHSVVPDVGAPRNVEPVDVDTALRGPGERGVETFLTIENASEGSIKIMWASGREERKSFGELAPGQSAALQTFAGHAWIFANAEGKEICGVKAPQVPSLVRVSGPIEPRTRTNSDLSPDGKWRARIVNHNLVIEPAAGGDAIGLTNDGTDGHGYSPPFHWSPDSAKLVAFRTKAVATRQITIVQSSPPDQLQPKTIAIPYAKPGDPIEQPQPHLFIIEGARGIPIDPALFPNPWEISEGAWTADSSEFSFVYNQRGHQVMRLVGVSADSGSTRTIIEDVSKTFIDYSQKFFLHRLPATRELLWASERDGFNRIYLIDELSGKIKNPITEGSIIVKEVVEVDETKRELLLKIVGVPDQDPYHEHFVRVNFDGTGLRRLTTGDGTHLIDISPGGKWMIDRWSRVDQPPVIELRHAENGGLVKEIWRTNDSMLVTLGWQRPERFVAKGRDGKTDIHGVIYRPTNFDPAKKYPVLEDIYAGPHDQHVHKDFSAWSGKKTMAELGFIVVSIDGMGTNWRGKAFHDVCWKNLADGGFPDRIAWIKAAAETRPWMDLSRVGIFGGSAGGQNAAAALLHHGDFYKVAVADCGCHDNRMDKIWWNEAWMGWPVDESYERSSNATHAAKLTGKLLLIVGEMDTNVDPASTTQLVAALQKADKDFEFQPIINAGHGAAETPYGKYRRAEFLMRNLGGAR
ncbi:MAG: Prolyl tripeptidyl peptidase precursor [Verrucomicrobiota bacterium]|jgi:dipeptidyl aminopeptidase/acylaminoacyl peptidase